MVRINRLGQNPNVNIYAKLEGFNPTGSIKAVSYTHLRGVEVQDGLAGGRGFGRLSVYGYPLGESTFFEFAFL